MLKKLLRKQVQKARDTRTGQRLREHWRKRVLEAVEETKRTGKG